MIAGEIQIVQFSYGAGDGKDPEGKPFKVLAIQDKHSKMRISYVFTPEEFEEFIRTISGNKLVVATEMPKGAGN